MIYVEGQPPTPGQPPPVVIYNHVDEPYFDTMRVPLLRGRVFRENDDDKAPLVAIVNQTMAQQFWPNQDPLGKRFSLKSATGPFIEVVGLAADGKFIFIGFDKKPYFFVPLSQNYTAYRTLQVRSSLPPESMIAQMQNEVRALDPNMPVSDVQTMRQSLSGGNGFFIFQVGAILAAAMGFLGLTLAVVGVYGVVSFAASQRTHEIGIRVALGATQANISRLVVGMGARLVSIGLAIGLIGTILVIRTVQTQVFDLALFDVPSAAAVVGLLTAVALLACYLPARRAARLDPTAALRQQ
jgi:putative ABC transport system permease protein